jgi:hypothetical protein
MFESGGSKTKPTFTYNYQQSDAAGTATKKTGRQDQLGSKSSSGCRASRSPVAPTEAREPEAELRR